MTDGQDSAAAAAHVDPFTPPQMALLVEEVGVRKVKLPALQMATLGMLAGAFISFGAMLYMLLVTGSELGFGPSRLVGGIGFSLGLILVVVGGAELFTGNNLIVMAWASRKVTTAELLRNLGLVYIANFAGALGTVVLFYLSGALELNGGAVAETAIAIARTKLQLGLVEGFFRGILCNVLVCLAIWLCFAARQVSGKILCILFPISAFVALGFEHSVANMFLIPIGMLASGTIDLGGFFGNLVVVTLGNLVGGGGLVALVYWLVYLRPPPR